MAFVDPPVGLFTVSARHSALVTAMWVLSEEQGCVYSTGVSQGPGWSSTLASLNGPVQGHLVGDGLCSSKAHTVMPLTPTPGIFLQLRALH